MSSAASPQPSDSHHGHRSTSSRWMTNRMQMRAGKKTTAFYDEYTSLVDESPEFHDPYSELNLFLSQKIRREMRQGEMRQEGLIKKWSLKIQEALLEKIAPEFHKKFPHYRLGVSALKKTWEKIAYYTEQIEAQKGAIDNNGNLRLSFLISENLRHYSQMTTISGFQPHHYAHQLGLKISECLAIVDGLKPSFEHLTRLIWSMQRHMLAWQTVQEAPSPYDEFDRLDKLVVKTILEVKMIEPHLSAVHLEEQVTESFMSLSEIPAFGSQETLQSTIAALIADKLYATSRIHILLSPQEKIALLRFIDEQIDHCKTKHPQMPLCDIVRRVLSLYLRATELPVFAPQDLEIVEIAIWRRLSEKEQLLTALPFRIGQRIETEIAQQLIDEPKRTFSSLVHSTFQAFHKMRDIFANGKSAEIIRKIHLWCAQGDLLFRSLRFEKETPLLRLIVKLHNEPHKGHIDFVARVCEAYLREHPALSYYSGQLFTRVQCLYKHAWFTLFSQKEETAVDRLLAWHAASFDFNQGRALFTACMETLFSEQLPFIPFDPKSIKC